MNFLISKFLFYYLKLFSINSRISTSAGTTSVSMLYGQTWVSKWKNQILIKLEFRFFFFFWVVFNGFRGRLISFLIYSSISRRKSQIWVNRLWQRFNEFFCRWLQMDDSYHSYKPVETDFMQIVVLESQQVFFNRPTHFPFFLALFWLSVGINDSRWAHNDSYWCVDILCVSVLYLLQVLAAAYAILTHQFCIFKFLGWFVKDKDLL